MHGLTCGMLLYVFFLMEELLYNCLNQISNCVQVLGSSLFWSSDISHSKMKCSSPLLIKTQHQHDLMLFGLELEHSEMDIKKAYKQKMLRLHPDKCTTRNQDEITLVQSVRERLLDRIAAPDTRSSCLNIKSPAPGQNWGFQLNTKTMTFTNIKKDGHLNNECRQRGLSVEESWRLVAINGYSDKDDIVDMLRTMALQSRFITITLRQPQLQTEVPPTQTSSPHPTEVSQLSTRPLPQPAVPPPQEEIHVTRPIGKQDQWRGAYQWCSFCGLWKYGGKRHGEFGKSDRSTYRWNVCLNCRNTELGDLHWWWCRDEAGNKEIGVAAVWH